MMVATMRSGRVAPVTARRAVEASTATPSRPSDHPFRRAVGARQVGAIPATPRLTAQLAESLGKLKVSACSKADLPYTVPASDALISRKPVAIALGGILLSAANEYVGRIDHANESHRSLTPHGLAGSPELCSTHTITSTTVRSAGSRMPRSPK